jgi:hypothetical protein
MTTPTTPSKPAAKGPRVLRIGVVKNGRIVEERIVRKRATVTIGRSERNHFVVHDERLPARFDLFELRGESYHLTFTDDMAGRVSTPSGPVDLATLRSSGLATPRGRCWQVELTERSRGKVAIGDSTLLFQFVTAPPAQPQPQLPAAVRGGYVGRIDWPFISITMATAVLEFGLVFWLVSKDWPAEAAWQAPPEDFVADVSLTQIDVERLRKQLERPVVPDQVDDPAAAPAEALPGGAQVRRPAKQLTPAERAERAEARAREAADRVARVRAAMDQTARAKLLTSVGERGGVVDDVLHGGDVAGSSELLDQINRVEVASRDGGGLLLGRSRESGDGLGKVAGIEGLRTEGGDRNVKSAGIGEERRPEPKVGRGPVPPPIGDGVVDPAEVRTAVSNAMGGIKACYERALRRDPTLQGRVTISFTIGATGRVTRAVPSNDTIGSAVSGCVADRFRLISVSPPRNGTVTFSYPFIFQPALQ